MGRGPALTNQEYWWVIGLHDGGVSLREISRKTGRSRTSARNAIRAERGPQGDDCGEKARAGRQPALTVREVRQIVRTAATGKFFSAELKTQLDIKASVRTIQRLLKNVDHLVYTKMDRTLPLTPARKAAHEKKFNLDGPDGFKYYWRDLRKPAQSYISRQNGGGSVMVWSAFGGKGKSELAILRGRQKSGDYIYTQDNVPIHASCETAHFLQEMQVDTMVWPARSPDCNPIENVWSVMAAQVYAHGRQYRTVEQLEETILLAWASIDQDYLDKLVESMPRRCLAVIKGKGGLIKY